MAVDLVLTRCPKLATLMGEEVWPNGTEVQEQLFDNLEQFHQTTMYITEAGLSICEHRRRRGTEVQKKLFGNLEQLHQMAMYITEAGLSI
jgi:hypothetical protein